MKENKIEKHWLGQISYEEGLKIQNEKVQLRINGKINDQVLLLEHEPVYTIGRTKDHSSLPDEKKAPFLIHFILQTGAVRQPIMAPVN